MRHMVFVVDDEPGIVRLCERLLGRAGFQVRTFNNPLQVLEILEEQRLDLLLVDIRMPGVDGFQVIESARRSHPDLAVVVMTGFGTVDTAIEALRRGADGLILKPFSGAELVQSVRRALQQSQSKQDVLRLQALRPLFDITESLFTETNPRRLQSLVLEAVCGHLHCSHAEFYQARGAAAAPVQKGERTTGGMRLVGSLHTDGNPLPGSQPPPAERKRNDGGLLTEPIARQADTLRTPLLIQRDAGADPALQQILLSRSLGSVMCAPVVLKAGAALRGVLLAARDLHEPHFRESDLEMFVLLARQAAVALENARLHAQLRDNIRQLEESQRALIQAEKMAIAGRLTASIAHEINNPLQSVQNCLHLAGRSELPAAQRQAYFSTAQSELERLMFTVQRMLDFYRPSALDRKPTDVNQLLQKVLSLAEKQLADHQVEAITELSPRLPPVLAVGDQVQQVFLNLVLNAMEAMPAGGKIFVKTSLQPFPAAQSQEQNTMPASVEILFEDTGPGVPPSDRKHIFEPFVSTKEKGTGLGLAVSYGIITAHGGSLDLVERRQRAAGQGACFRVTLPVAEHT